MRRRTASDEGRSRRPGDRGRAARTLLRLGKRATEGGAVRPQEDRARVVVREVRQAARQGGDRQGREVRRLRREGEEERALREAALRVRLRRRGVLPGGAGEAGQVP